MTTDRRAENRTWDIPSTNKQLKALKTKDKVREDQYCNLCEIIFCSPPQNSSHGNFNRAAERNQSESATGVLLYQQSMVLRNTLISDYEYDRCR
jgi:hypothetical protein